MLSNGSSRFENWESFSCYGTPYLAKKKVFWENLEAIVESLTGPWLIVGDLNEIKSEYENIGGMVFERTSFSYKSFCKIQKV